MINKELVMNAPFAEGMNELTIKLLRDEIQMKEATLNNLKETEKEELTNEIESLYQLAYVEIENPKELSFNEKLAFSTTENLGFEINNNKVVSEIVEYKEGPQNFKITVYKDPQELKAEYFVLTDQLKNEYPEFYAKHAFNLAQLYDGAIKDYQLRAVQKTDSASTTLLLAEKLEKLASLKPLAKPEQLKEINFLSRKLLTAIQFYTSDLPDKYQLDFLEEENIDYLILLMTDHIDRAEKDFKEFYHSNPESKEKKEKKEQYDLSSEEVVKDYSKEAVVIKNMSIADKVYNIAIATGQKVSVDDPVMVEAFESCLAKTKAQLKNFSPEKAEKMRRIYGQNWEEGYLEQYSKTFKSITKREFEKTYDSALESRKIEIKQSEAEFSLNGNLNPETLENLDKALSSMDNNSPYETAQAKNLHELIAAFQEKDLKKFQENKTNLKNANYQLLRELQERGEIKDETDFLGRTSFIEIASYLITEIDNSSKVDSKRTLALQDHLNKMVPQKEESKGR